MWTVPVLSDFLSSGQPLPVSPADALRNLVEGPQDVRWRDYTERQTEFINAAVKRIIICAGRRSGKTTGLAARAVRDFVAGGRVLYGGPTVDQLDHFWQEVLWLLDAPIAAGHYRVNRSRHTLTVPGSRQRLRAKTVWIPDDLRGDFADTLLLDEFQMMNEDVWRVVAQPMLIDHDGTAILSFTPPSLVTRSMSRARDKRHASRMYREVSANPDMGWKAMRFTTLDNPHISKKAVERMRAGMTTLAYRQEILAQDPDEIPGAIWTRKLIDDTRKVHEPEDLTSVVVGVDPPGGGTECGIVTAAKAVCMCRGVPEDHVFVLSDASLKDTPRKWAGAVLEQFDGWRADRVVGEGNYGGDMVEHTLRTERFDLPFTMVRASRGKAVRAEPVMALYESGKVHHVGEFPALESEMTEWVPGVPGVESPNRLDALVWAIWYLMLRQKRVIRWGHSGVGEDGW